MTETTFTFRVDADLKERFSEAAREQDRAGSQLLRDFMRSFVTQRTDAAAYDAWFRQQVQGALDDPRPPVPTKTVEQHFAKRRAAARRKSGARTR
ncbi:MAG: CopG family ribbon-helix-helix protein [Gammaproteobacteria bacterium]